MTAAGLSSRMGTNKLLLPLAGRPIVRRVVETARDACRRVIVVVGHERDSVAASACEAGDQRVSLVFNPRFELGMFSSIQVGMREVESDWFYVVPGDLPLLDAGTFADVLSGLRRHAGSSRRAEEAKGAPVTPVAAIPRHRGRRGHPVLLSSALSQAVLALRPDSGPLRDVLRQRRSIFVEIDSSAISTDIDTREDYESLLQSPSRSEAETSNGESP